MDRYRIVVTTVGAVVGVVMVLLFSLVAAENLLMQFHPGPELAPAQSVMSDDDIGPAVNLPESDSGVELTNERYNYPAQVSPDVAVGAGTAEPQAEQTAWLQPPAPQTEGPLDNAGGLLTAIVGSELVLQTTGTIEELVEMLLPIQSELDVKWLPDQIQNGLTGNGSNEAIKSLLLPLF